MRPTQRKRRSAAPTPSPSPSAQPPPDVRQNVIGPLLIDWPSLDARTDIWNELASRNISSNQALQAQSDVIDTFFLRLKSRYPELSFGTSERTYVLDTWNSAVVIPFEQFNRAYIDKLLHDTVLSIETHPLSPHLTTTKETAALSPKEIIEKFVREVEKLTGRLTTAQTEALSEITNHAKHYEDLLALHSNMQFAKFCLMMSLGLRWDQSTAYESAPILEDLIKRCQARRAAARGLFWMPNTLLFFYECCFRDEFRRDKDPSVLLLVGRAALPTGFSLREDPTKNENERLEELGMAYFRAIKEPLPKISIDAYAENFGLVRKQETTELLKPQLPLSSVAIEKDIDEEYESGDDGDTEDITNGMARTLILDESNPKEPEDIAQLRRLFAAVFAVPASRPPSSITITTKDASPSVDALDIF
jgi:hypothetical protein